MLNLESLVSELSWTSQRLRLKTQLQLLSLNRSSSTCELLSTKESSTLRKPPSYDSASQGLRQQSTRLSTFEQSRKSRATRFSGP